MSRSVSELRKFVSPEIVFGAGCRHRVGHFASAFGAQIDVFWYAGPTALVNDSRWATFAGDVAAHSGYRTRHADLHMGGEDFAVYLQHIPGAFVSIGSASEFGLHHPAYNPDDNLIAPAARYFAALAEQALGQI